MIVKVDGQRITVTQAQTAMMRDMADGYMLCQPFSAGGFALCLHRLLDEEYEPRRKERPNRLDWIVHRFVRRRTWEPLVSTRLLEPHGSLRLRMTSVGHKVVERLAAKQ